MSKGDQILVNKKNPPYLSNGTKSELYKVYDEYCESYSDGSLDVDKARGYRTACWSILDARLEALATQGKTDDPEYEECVFLSDALKKGWLVTDVLMLSEVFDLVHSLPAGSSRRRGMDLMAELASKSADTTALRTRFLDVMTGYFHDLEIELENTRYSEKISDVIEAVGQANLRATLPSEYPKEPIEEDYDKKVLERQNYTMEKLTVEELEAFELNDARRFHDIKKSNRQAIKEVMGEEVYDDIDEMYTGKLEDRKVVIHHAQGNKWLKSGEDVLEMNFLGSARTDEWREHKRKDGFIDTDGKTDDQILAEYGTPAQNADGKAYSYIRFKDREFDDGNGHTFKKRKYVIGGTTPGLFGALNVGENSIENVKYYGRDFAAKFLKPHFDRWIDGNEDPHDLHISLTGWSRGAVAAGQAIKKIDEWIQKYKLEHPGIEQHLGRVKIDALLKDPVPGAITNFHLSTCNLRYIPNLNMTVYCTLASDHYDLLYPFQHVKGAKKLILATEKHDLDFERVDYSQKAQLEDGKAHQSGFYDAETGEFFRGTGVSQLQNGVYICDDRHNLVRLSSYSQLGKLMKSVFEKGGPQRTRKKNLHKMVRDWFVENTLEMGFADEETRTAAKEKNRYVEDRILASPNKRIAPVRDALRGLRELMQGQPSRQQIVQQNQRLITVCREYMKKTAIPASGDSEYRVNLVSDLLSFTMRETNQLNTEIRRETDPNYTGELDAKIRAHRERLDQKEGALERKLQKEQGRLQKEKTIANYIKETKKLCTNYLGDLRARDRNRLAGITSDEYDAMTEALERGSNLNRTTASATELIEVLREISKATDKYVETHKGIVGPLTDDGRFRQNVAKSFSDFSKDMGRKTEELSAYLADRDLPLDKNIQRREEGINSLTQKIAARQNLNVQEEPEQPQMQA